MVDDQALPVGEFSGTEGLNSDLVKPHGQQQIITEHRPDTLAYLPSTPDLQYTGAYVYLAAVYAIVNMQMSLWEYYHSQSDINLQPRTYITDYAPIEIYGTTFDQLRAAHRLHWHSDREALVQFLGFLQTLILKHDEKQRIWALALHEIQVPYPKDNDIRSITCVVVLPYSHTGAFVPSDSKGAHGRPVIKWVNKDTCAAYKSWQDRQDECRRAEARAFQDKKPYLGERAQPNESYTFYKAPEIKATIDLLWGEA